MDKEINSMKIRNMIMVSESEIREFLFDVTNNKKVDLNNDDPLIEKGIIDSMVMLEMIAFIEEKYGIQIEDEEIVPENFDSINKIVAYIREKSVI